MNIESTIKRFLSYCKEKRIDQAIVLSIPSIGPGLNEILNGGRVEKLLNQVQQQNEEINLNIKDALERVMSGHTEGTSPILVLGSGNGDHVLSYKGYIKLGSKLFVDSKQSIGGSGVNFTLRLLAAGYNAIPIVSIGDDLLGNMVRDRIISAARRAGVPRVTQDLIGSSSFFAPNVKTPQSTIVIEGDRRTIFAEKLQGGEFYRAHVEKRTSEIDDALGCHPSAVLIGHIHTDGIDSMKRDEELSTIFLMQRYAGKCPIFLNFGKNQIDIGAGFWEKQLDGVTLMQFNLEEARQFLHVDNKVRSLMDIVRWFAERSISIVLTFGRFGAIGSYKDGRNGLILAWPLLRNDEAIVDSTGAGDAFAAGITAHLRGNTNLTFQTFHAAIEKGRAWAAYACTKLGAANDCPDPQELCRFLRGRRTGTYRAIEIIDSAHVEQTIELIDLAFVPE